MNPSPRKIAILGSTGSIGRSTLEVVRHSRGRFQVAALSAHRSCEELLAQAIEYRPRFVVVSSESAARECDWSGLPRETELLVGSQGVERIGRQHVRSVKSERLRSEAAKMLAAASDESSAP